MQVRSIAECSNAVYSIPKAAVCLSAFQASLTPLGKWMSTFMEWRRVFVQMFMITETRLPKADPRVWQSVLSSGIDL